MWRRRASAWRKRGKKKKGGEKEGSDMKRSILRERKERKGSVKLEGNITKKILKRSEALYEEKEKGDGNAGKVDGQRRKD